MIASADGCKAGWVVAFADGWPCSKAPQLVICRDFEAVVEVTSTCRVVVVDIPIGLPTGREKRVCDVEAKKELGKEGSARVFFAPPRESLNAENPEAFQASVKKLTGRGAGLPVWGLVPKLREVDAVMSADIQNRILEFHPELVWKRLAGKTLVPKHTEEGIRQRRGLLKACVPNLDSLLEWPKKAGRAVRADDILDAFVGLAAAGRVQHLPDSQWRLPVGDTLADDHGLRMEIWF